MKILLTGSSGFIGHRLSEVLTENGLSVVGCVRTSSQAEKMPIDTVIVEDIASFNYWNDVLKEVDVIIHLAAISHDTKSVNNIDRINAVNLHATLMLGKYAVEENISRFIYISSIGVLGDSTTRIKFNNRSEYNPKNSYSNSKMEAEIGLKKITKKTEMELVIIRPPLVYGPGAPGNFDRLIRLVDTGMPLPLGAMNKKKSMISLDNLCDFLMNITTKVLPNQFIELNVSDGHDWSTVELINTIYKYLKKRNLLFYMPISILIIIAFLLGKLKEIRKMSVPLLIDEEDTNKVINWTPVQSAQEGVRLSVEYYLKHK